MGSWRTKTNITTQLIFVQPKRFTIFRSNFSKMKKIHQIIAYTKIATSLFLLFLCATTGWTKEKYRPQIVNPVLEPWQWAEYPELDTVQVNCLSRSRNGSLWIGTGTHAIYHDGYQLHAMEVDSTQLISMAHDRGQNLLIATQQGIYRYIDNLLEPLLKVHFSGQHQFLTDKNGYIWIGSPHGLLKITPWHIRCFNPEGIFELAPDGSITNRVASFTNIGQSVHNIHEIDFPLFKIHNDEHDIFWAACQYKGYEIAEIRNLHNVFTQSDWSYHHVDKLRAEGMSGICRNGNTLLITSGNPNIGIQALNLTNEQVSTINLSSIGGDDLHTAMFKTSDGKIWIGGHSKIYTLQDQDWRLYQYPEVKLPLSYISIFIDSNDHIYMNGTGMFRKLEYANGSYTTFQGLNFQCNTPDYRNWFTTRDGMVVEADSSLTNFYRYNTRDGLMDMTMLLYFSKKGQLWAAGSHLGEASVAQFDGQKWIKHTFPDFHFGISYDGVKELGDSSIVFSSNGVLSFVSPNPGGLIEYHYPSRQWRTYHWPQVPQRIPSVDQTSDGRLWFSGGAISYFDGKNTTAIDSLKHSSGWTDDIVVGSENQIWAAQGGIGLFHFDGKKWQRFGVKNGLASNMVTNLYFENEHSLLIATDNGISCFDGKQFISHIMHPNIGIAREKGTIRLSTNRNIWINQGSREWYLYDMKNTRSLPQDITKAICYHRDTNAPDTYITFAENEIPPEGNVLIRFDGKDFMHKTSSDKLQFSYRINQGEWSLFSNDKSALLLDLTHGDYIFEVRTRDMDLNIDESPAMVQFVVQAPVHKRAWFILTILGFLSIIIYLQIRLYIRNKEIHELDQFKLRLFTDISHELKTPLTLIMLPLQKLRDLGNVNEASQRYIELIHGNVERLSNLVHQVIDFRRLESKTIVIDPAPADLIQQLQIIYQYYKPLAEEKGFNFILQTDDDELWLDYDTDKLEKMIANLLSNAFKYTPGNGLVELHQHYELSTGTLIISVSDNGPGIPPEMQKNIFNRFYRLKNSQLSKIPGSGIGLSLVKELVSLHHGTIEVLSDGENGTEFRLHLPLKKTDKAKRIKHAKFTDSIQNNSTEKPLLLLIEDEEQMLGFVSEELAEYFEVMPVTTAEKGLECLGQMPDLIISDVMLPGIDGMEFCRRVKESNETCHIPLILLTARDTEENILQGISTGADDYITKPFSMNELKARSLGLIENRKRLSKRFAENKPIKAENFTTHKGDQLFLDKALEVVYQHLDNPEFDVAMFCSLTNTSKTLLYSKLKTLTGQSATEFVRNIRLKEARQMLLDPNNTLSVAEVSYQVGFNDPLYFSRCFKKYFGIPPSEASKL